MSRNDHFRSNVAGHPTSRILVKPRESRSAAGLVLGVIAYRMLRDEIDQPVIRSLPTVAIGWSAIVSGLIAWRSDPGTGSVC